MKTYKISESPTKYSALSSLVGVKREGFYENSASKILNLKPDGEVFKLRNGIMKGYSLPGEVLHSQSVNVGGYVTSFIVIDRFIYEIECSGHGEDLGEIRYASPYELTPGNMFFFSSANDIFFFDGRKVLKLAESVFTETDYGVPSAEIKLPFLPYVRKSDTELQRNILNGKINLAFSLPCDTETVSFEEAPASIDFLYINGQTVNGYSLTGNLFAFPEPRNKGDNIVIGVTFSESPLQSLGLKAAGEESEGRTYIHSSRKLFSVSSIGGKPVIKRTPVSLPAGNIKKVFFTSGVPTLAIGDGISVYDEEAGTLRQIDCDGVESEADICPAGGYTFLSTADEVLRLSLTRSGDGENLSVVSMKDHFTDRERRKNLAMAYSKEEACLYTVSESRGEKRIYILDTKSGVWFEADSVESPVNVFPSSDSIVILGENYIYFTSPEMSEDYDFETDSYYSICGEITLSESFLGDPFGKKNIKLVAGTLSGKIDLFSVSLLGDNGKFDEYLLNYEDSAQKNIFEIFRMNIGRFKALTMKIFMRGRDNASIHDVYLTV